MSEEEIRERLTRLETKFDMFCDNHDKTANEFKATVMAAISAHDCPKDEIRKNSDFIKAMSKALWIIFGSLAGLTIKVVFFS